MTGVVIVTGGGRGIGAATVRVLHAAGWRVVFSWLRDAEAAASVAAVCPGSVAVQADCATEAGIAATFAAADALGTPLRGLVNNAGITGPAGRIEDATAADLTRLMSVNVVGPILCCRQAIRRMSSRHGGAGGAIVNISSIAATLGGAGELVPYAASKGALDSLTIGLAREVAAERIRVNAVSPGVIATDIHAAMGKPDRPAQAAAVIPMGRAGTAEEVADAIRWLLADVASYVTGANIAVTGGR